MSSDTRQEAFDIMVSGLIKQGKPSYDIQTMGCMYDNGAGQKCAVGMLIPDDDYSPLLEGKGVPTIAFKAVKFGWKTKHLFNEMNYGMLDAVRTTHDMSVTFYTQEGTEKWVEFIKSKYKDLAFMLGLEWSHG